MNSSKHSFNRMLDLLKGHLPTIISEGEDSTSQKGLAHLENALGLSHITGLKMKLSGRLTTQRSSPRQTVQAGRLGSSAKGLYSTTDYSQSTTKNKLGALTMKV